ncbi:tyrosine-protein phosphatase 10D-like isoform X2 [Pararge aegeria]|uniref:tyrosine-protein phosphatase 10D-like isoform X2 n=1 Tax=Pararge aegeria TaxID=116150 RepID=UPI0019D09E15|nr:tyrosine-protein phosphatase 10D-like isoform X2 [Pararge aegeria]
MLPRAKRGVYLEEKVSCEIGESPSMMWKRSIVQARAGQTRATAASSLALGLIVFVALSGAAHAADLVIEIPGWGAAGAAGAHYRLDYRPPQGSPAPNFTVPARASTINFQGLPGTQYHFMLYYSNDTFADLLTWNQTIITAPEPPSNLTVTLGRNKQATILWAPPAHGDYTGFRFKVIPLSERAEGGARNVSLEGAGNWSHVLRDLSPGATYQLHAFTLLRDKESAAYASFNFTTKPNTPGKFIVWFRNETTLLVLWQPPYPPGAYTHYKVSIEPRDARDSELYVEKEGEPPGPAQAAFKGLVPGRAYNISVQTVSDAQLSAPTTAQYRTVPLRPRNVSVDPRERSESAFRVTWLPPAEQSEFEKYQVSVAPGAGARRLPPQLRARADAPAATFEGLEPGAHYAVTVKTMSGKVTSWPAAADVTLKPLPVRELQGRLADGEGGGVFLWWQPAEGSVQDEYRVSYHETGPSRDDSSALSTAHANATLAALLPGRNYTVSVAAVSRGVASNDSVFLAATRPLAPALRAAAPQQRALALAWRSDVDSRQDGYELRYRRRAADAPFRALATPATNATLPDLLPGAVYEIQLAAVSHGLRSERLTVLKPVRPLPPEWMAVERASSNAVLVRWRGPSGGVVGAYSLRYQAADGPWRRLEPLPADRDRAEISNMTHGERYRIQLDTLSEDAAGDAADSAQPLSAQHTVRPNPVSDVAQLADTRNVTLEWPRPAGRVEWYRVRWWAADDAGAAQQRDVGAADAPTSRVLLGELLPGRAYALSIAAHSHNLSSELFTMSTRTRPLIQSEMTIVNESGDDDGNDTLPAIRVLYTPTPLSATLFDEYRFRLEGGDEPARWERRAAAAPDQQVEFAALVPGRLYSLTMWTVSHNVTSHPVQRPARLFPRPVAALQARATGPRGVALSWPRPPGDFTDFEVQFLLGDDQLEARTTERLALELGGLRPYTLYTFSVEVRAGAPASLLTRSAARSASVRTLEAPPAAPARFQPSDAAPSQLSFTWELAPQDAHGELLRFVLQYWAAREPGAAREAEFPPGARAGCVRGLAPGELYEFRLAGATRAGLGAAAAWRQRMAIAAPPRPRALPAAVRRSASTVTVSWRADDFSAANGNVTAYALVVAEEPRADSPQRLPAWRDVHRLPVWPPYQVSEPYYPFRAGGAHASPVEEFTVGAEQCDGAEHYCNGPLKPATRYYVKLRAFTAQDKFTDTAYAVVYTDADHTGWAAGGAAAAALLLAAGAGAALFRRRARAPAAPAAPAASRPVRVADFADHYRRMAADSDFRFSEEFDELKHVGREQPCAAADLPVNRPKNRFTNILPYDHSRFKLQPVDDEEGSDYINANYVPGHSSPREFIVTQGPLHCTRDDFWRMCWESGSRAIVMLTRCVEKGREKCDRYWPYDTRPVYYGDIAVTALNESRYPDWTVTELAVCRGAEQRVVAHFHFTTWPDFGVPSPPTALARFVRAFRERCPAAADARPVVVHCSAGVGRSGTFVTLDRALQQLAARADALDIFGMVHAMRRERVWMVQTEQQYICVHQCVLAALEGADLAPPPPANHHHHNAAFEGC